MNVGENSYNLIPSLYGNSSCSKRVGENKTQSLSYSRGVREVYILGPHLLNFYINNLPHLFENILSKPIVLPNGTRKDSLFDYTIKLQSWITKLFQVSHYRFFWTIPNIINWPFSRFSGHESIRNLHHLLELVRSLIYFLGKSIFPWQR